MVGVQINNESGVRAVGEHACNGFQHSPIRLGRYLPRPSLSTCAYNRNLCTLVNSAEVSGCSAAHERKVQVERLPHQHDTRQA